MDRVWRSYLAVGGALLLGYGFLPAGLPRDLLYQAFGVACVAAVAVGVRWHRPRRRRPWVLTATGFALWCVGDGVWSVYENVLHEVPWPSAADGFYLAAYPFLLAGLAQLVGLRQRSRDLPALVDSLIVTIGCGLVSWVVLAGPVVRAPEDPLLTRVVGAAYPAGDILLLGVLVRLLTAPGARTTAFKLLLAGAALLPVVDTAFLLDADGVLLVWLDLGWQASYLLFGAAALHPSMTQVTETDGRPVLPVTRWRLLALTLAVLTAPATLAVQTVLGATPDVWSFVVGACALFGLVVLRMALAIRVVTEADAERSRLADTLAHAAAHDPLTGLANRARALELVEAALFRARRSGGTVGLLCVDLDHFKRVNDTFGHRAGDAVLREVAARMAACVRGGDTVGRLGGDEFVVLVEPVDDETDVVVLAQRLVAAVGDPVVVGPHGETAVVGASIGVALSRDGSTDAAALLHDADVAAYRAKGGGRGRVEVFDAALRADAERQVRLVQGLRRALAEDSLELHYQPVFDMAGGRVLGYEALLRWRQDDGTLLTPGAFLPEAERSTLGDDLGRWALFRATSQLARWRAQDPAFADRTVAVNVSARHLLSRTLADDVRRALDASGLPADRLVLEVSEATLLENPACGGQVDTLRALGVRVAIDEFGAGLASVAQLGTLRADLLKIDRELVGSPQRGSRALVQLLVHAGHALGLRVVAEGVETEAHLHPLRQAGCDAVQGHLLSHPLPADAVPQVRPVPQVPQQPPGPHGPHVPTVRAAD